MSKRAPQQENNGASLLVLQKMQLLSSLDEKREQKVLIVDDEPVNLKLLGAHLRKGGYTVIEAPDGKSALEKAEQTKPDLILLDIMMPGMDGLETCHFLKENDETKDVPVIFLSALSDSEVKTKGLEVGGVDYISKPFDSREMLARVKTHLTLKTQERQIRLYAGNLEEMVQKRTRELEDAQHEIRRDFDIQTVIAALLRSSLDTADLEGLMDETLEHILSVTSFSFQPSGCIFLVDGETQHLRPASCRNIPEDQLSTCLNEGTHHCVMYGDAAEDAGAFDEPQEAAGARSHFCVPIRYDDRLLGVILVYIKEGHRPDDKERGFLQAVADTLARVVIYKQAQQRLVESEEQYRAIFENTGTAMAMITADYTIELINTGFESLAGVTMESLGKERSLLDFFHPEDRDAVFAIHEALREDRPADTSKKEFRFQGAAGDMRYVALIESNIPGVAGNVVSLSDITDRKRAEEQVLYHAFHDSLTDLPNRIYLLDKLGKCVERAKSDMDYSFAVMLMDLDRFNLVNESLGHDIGDKLIIELAERLRSSISDDDLLVRLGGDEFAILYENMGSLEDVTDLATRILGLVRHPFVLEGNELVSTSSIGIALSAMDYERGEDLLRDADTALHRAKQRGKARYEVFDTEMHLKAKSLLALVTDMRQALKRGEYLLHYQPIVDIASGAVQGFEALVRWNHPTRGMVSPAEFIPEAEESGLIIPIGQWVLHEACTTMQRMYKESGLDNCLMLSVNLSGKQFAHEDIFEHVSQVLNETGFDPNCLKLEITESAIMEDAAAATEMLYRLKSLNVHVSIDDFGTGYSSLSYLHRFPVDMLKIDRSFVSSIFASGENLEIVRTIIALAHNLGLEVIAEGVETSEQLETIKSLGCEYAQGYYFSRPVDVQALVKDDLFHKVW